MPCRNRRVNGWFADINKIVVNYGRKQKKRKFLGVDPGGDHPGAADLQRGYEPLVDLSGFLNESDPDHRRCARQSCISFFG